MQRYKVHNPPVRYSFTHEGRVAAHKLTGVLDSDEVQSRCQKLTAAVKAHVTDEGERQRSRDPFSLVVRNGGTWSLM
jgi:hypothetical protein